MIWKCFESFGIPQNPHSGYHLILKHYTPAFLSQFIHTQPARIMNPTWTSYVITLKPVLYIFNFFAYPAKGFSFKLKKLDRKKNVSLLERDKRRHCILFRLKTCSEMGLYSKWHILCWCLKPSATKQNIYIFFCLTFFCWFKTYPKTRHILTRHYCRVASQPNEGKKDDRMS